MRRAGPPHISQVSDDLVLFALEPAEEGHHEELQRNHTAESMPNCSAQLPDITRFTAGLAEVVPRMRDGSRP